MMRKDLRKIQNAIDEHSQPHELLHGRPEPPSLHVTRMSHLGNLKEKMRRRSRQVPYGDDLYLELRDYRIPGILDIIIHFLGVHPWIDADHEKWGSVRVCPLCGRCEWTIYPRRMNDWREAPVHYCAGALMDFIKTWKEMNR